MPDGKLTKAEVIAQIRATQPKSAGYTDEQILDRLVKKAPEFVDKISDYKVNVPKPAPDKGLPMFQQQLEATMITGQPKKAKSDVEQFTEIEKKKEKASVLNTPIPSYSTTPIAGQQDRYNEAAKIDDQASKDLAKFEQTFLKGATYNNMLSESESKVDQFRSKDVDGFDFVDQQKLRQYVRTKVPEAANTGFETYLMSRLTSNLSYKMDEPKIMKRAAEIAKKKNITLPENFTNIDKEYTKKAQSISNKVSSEIDTMSKTAELEVSQLNNQYAQGAKDITAKYSNPEFLKNFTSQEELQSAYKQESAALFDSYSKQFSNSKRKYNQLSQKLQSDYEKAISTLNISGQADAKKVADLLKESVASLNYDKNALKYETLGFLPTSGLPNAVTRHVAGLGRSLAGYMNDIASYIEMNSDSNVATSFRDYSANLAKTFENPQIKIEKASDLLDIKKMTAYTGDQLGRMIPGIAAAAAITYGTGGAGAGAAVIPTLAGGTVAWFDQTMQATGGNYNALLEQGVNPIDAKNRANRTYAGYLATLPLSVIGMGGILGKFGSGNFLRRYGTGLLAELSTEIPEEIIQNEQDEAIAQNRKFDYGKLYDLKNAYTTGLSVLPTVAVMGGPGAVRESAAKGEGFLPEWVGRVANAPVQALTRNILTNGLYANQAALESMRHNGMITEEGSIQMKAKMAEIKSDMDQAKAFGLNRKQQSTYAGLMANVRTMEESVANIDAQEMDDKAKEEALGKANKRLENSKQAAADFLKTKNGNYAEVYDRDGDRYIVSHDELSEMLDDSAFSQDVKKGDARVQLFYDKKAGELLGDVSKRLLSLNKNYSSGIREYTQSEQNLNALRARLGVPAQPTSSTTVDGLVGQKGTFTLSRFPARVTTEGTLAVQNGKLVIEEDGGAITELGDFNDFKGVSPSFIGMEFTPPKYTGPKMTQAEAKLPSLLAMYAGKIDPKTLVSVLGDMISDIKKPQLTKLVNAFDSAYQRKQQQKSINESLPKPQKLINVEPLEVGIEVDGMDAANTIAQVGDKNASTFTQKMLKMFNKMFITNRVDLDDLHETSEEFRARVEEVRGQKQGQYNQEFSNPENIPAVMVDGKIIDGMGRLAQLYVNGQKTATVFESTKTEQDATKASEREIEEGAEPSSVSEYQGTEEAGTQAAPVQTGPSNRPVSRKGKRKIAPRIIQTTPKHGRFTADNIDDVYNISGLNKLQRKVINDARKVFDAIGGIATKLGTTLSINVHNQESFARAVLEAGGSIEEVKARGFYMADDGSIHLNMDKIASDTMLHEGFHPVLDFLSENNPAVINALFKQLESLPGAAKIIAKARQTYEGDTVQKKEAITDFVAGVADGRIVINPSNFQKIKAFIQDMLKSIGIGEGSTMVDATSNEELINLAKFITEKFTTGTAIESEELSQFMKQPSGYETADGTPISNRQAQFSLGNDFKDKKTKTTFTYIKNNEQFENLKRDGFITEDKVLDDFIGKRMMLHSPDNAFTGIISKNGKILIEGKGGVFYPIRFHEDGYFWASTDNAANSMANTLNEMIESNGGKIYLALVSAPANKLLSSTTASNGVVEFFTRFSKDNIPGLSQESVIDQMISAAAVVEEKKVKKQDKNGNDMFDEKGNPVYVLKNVGLGINIPKSKIVKGESVSLTIDAVRKIIAKKLSPQNSTFADRKLFALKLIGNIAKSIKGTNAEQYLGEFFTKGILNEAYIQQGKIENRYNLSAANITQSLSDMLSEPMLKNSNTGEVYAVIEIEGKVEPVKSDQHESYPMAIRSQVGNKTTLHILQEREKWEDRFADPETGMAVEKKRKLNVFPTSGVSATGLTLLEKKGPAFQKIEPQFQSQKIPSQDVINGFYSPIKKRINEFKLPNASSQKWKEIVGIKSDEAVFSGLTDWLNSKKPNEQISKDDINKFMKDNRIEIGEKTRGGDYEVYKPSNGMTVKYFDNLDDAEAFVREAKSEGDNYDINEPVSFLGTKYESYQLPGGENYKEILITLPGKDQFKSSHFDETNIITHLRMNTRTDADGKKVLFLEEVQSDWGQKGKKEGFGLSEDDVKRLRELGYDYKNGKVGMNVYETFVPKNYNDLVGEAAQIARKAQLGVSPAPYVSNTNAWVKLGLKVALKEAIKQGADRIAWTTGEQQSDRFNLSKTIESIKAIRKGVPYFGQKRPANLPRYYTLKIKYKNGEEGQTDMADRELADAVGKDLADKIIADNGGVYSGLDLQVGSKGMKAFYGDANTPGIVGNVAKALVKELTGKDGNSVSSKIKSADDSEVVADTEDIKRLSKAGYTFVYNGMPVSKQKAYELIEEGQIINAAIETNFTQPAIDITPELKTSVKEGMPQFQKAPIKWEKSPEGKGDPSISARNPIVLEAAKNLKAGKITNEEYRATVSANSPITPITRFFEPATEQEVRGALSSDKIEKVNAPIEEGTVVGLRLDIPAYTNNNTWVVSVHEGPTNKGKAISYNNVARITDVKFGVEPKGAINIAAGKNKATIGRMFGKWNNIPGNTMEKRGENIKNLVQDIVNDPNYVQVGMNPFRHSYFYDRSSEMGRPLVSADEVIQIGGLVYAKNPVYGNWTDEAYRVEGLFDSAGASMQFQKATPTKSSYEAVNQSVVGRMLGNSERAVTVKKKLARGIPIIQQYLTSFKKFGEDIYESGDYKVGFINQEMRKSNKYVDQAIEAFKKSAKDGFPVKDVDVNNFIEGDKTALNGYPAYVPIAVTNMRVHIDALTDNLITVGAITDPAEIALFRSNKGKYFGRYYDLFINGKDGVSLDNIKEKLKNVDQSVINAAKNLIRTELRKSVNRQNVGKTRAEIDKILENKVNDQIERILSGRENNFVKTPVKGSVNMKALTERMDIKPEIRALMGEVNNPLVRYYSTIKKMSEIAAGIQYLNEFRAKGLGKFLFEENDPNRPEGANFEISTDKNPNLQPLGGLWTYKEFYDELTANLEPARLNMIDRVAGKAFAGSKYFKTVANPGTHVKNVVSNVLIFVNNGYIGADLAKSIYKLSTDSKLRENLLEVLTKSNVLSNNIDINTIKSFVKENNDLDKIIADKFTASDWKKYSYKKIGGWLSGAYQFEDEIFKILAFMVEAERYSKDIYSVSYEDLAASQKTIVDKLMSARVKSVMPTFSRVPAFVQGMNKYLYLAAFMAFAAESVRIEKNNFMIALKELADSRTRGTGAKRLAGMTTINYMFWSKTTGAAAAVGALATGSFTYGMSALKELMDDEDDEVKAQMTQREKDLRLWVREFSNSSDLANIKITKDGISYIDIGAYHPFGFRHKIMNRFDQLVRDEQEGVIMDAGRALGHGFDPFLTPDFTAKAFIDAINDIDKYEKSISNPNDPAFVRRIDQATYFLQEAFAPGIVNNIIRSRKETRRGEEEKAKEAMMDTIVREDNIEFTKAFFFKFKNDWGKRLEAANEYYNDPINNAESKESIKAGYERAVDTKKEVIKDIVKYYQSAIRLGANETELAEIVQKMAPSRAIAELIRGDFEAAYPDVYVRPRE